MVKKLQLLERIIKEDAPKFIIDRLMQKFEDLIIPYEDEEDPDRPSLCNDEFKLFLEETISENLTVAATAGGIDIKIGVGDAQKMGLSEDLDENTTDCVKIIGTILAGIVGNYILVTTGMTSDEGPEGRFGKAFLVPEKQYRIEAVSKGWDPNKKVWKFSNFPGIPNFFDLDLNEFIEDTIKKFEKVLKSNAKTA
jgi:hypothetical protein